MTGYFVLIYILGSGDSCFVVSGDHVVDKRQTENYKSVLFTKVIRVLLLRGLQSHRGRQETNGQDSVRL